MNNVSVEEMAEEIIKIEEQAIKKKLDTPSGADSRFGRHKIDSDVVNKVLAIIEAGGVGNEN